MSSWIDDIKKQKSKGIDPVEIVIGESAGSIKVPLKRPTAGDKAAVLDVIDEVNKLDLKEASTQETIEYNDKIMLNMVKGCIDGELPDDDDLLFLLNESGGFSSDLMKKCTRLMGMGGFFADDVPTTDRSNHRTKKSRGR